MRDPKPVIIVGLCVLMAAMMAMFTTVTGSTNERRTNTMAETNLQEMAMEIHAKAYGACIRSGKSDDACDIVADKALEKAGLFYDKQEGVWKKGKKAAMKPQLGVK